MYCNSSLLKYIFSNNQGIIIVVPCKVWMYFKSFIITYIQLWTTSDEQFAELKLSYHFLHNSY